jgi:hypothetical protein
MTQKPILKVKSPVLFRKHYEMSLMFQLHLYAILEFVPQKQLSDSHVELTS